VAAGWVASSKPFQTCRHRIKAHGFLCKVLQFNGDKPVALVILHSLELPVDHLWGLTQV
jgi:hypothetical protein